MAQDVNLGNDKKAYVKLSTNYTWLGGEQNNSLNRNAEAIEVSDKSNNWKQFISGAKEASVEITVYAKKNDPAQMAALEGFATGATVDWFVGELGASEPESGDYGKAIVTAVNDTNNYNAVATRSISLKATGEVTHV